MSVAIIISAHGIAAKQLLMTAEMLIGKQQNVAYIDFVPGENADTLIEKYNNKINALYVIQGVLFLVDMWGGSPFNAANRIIEGKAQGKYDIVTGVNIPMLISTLLSRDDNPTLNELVSIALETGRSEIKSLNRLQVSNAPQYSRMITPTIPKKLVINADVHNHMLIVLTRIDDRLIHGQVAIRWTKETNVKRIIVVSNAVFKDQIRSTLLKKVAPPGVTAHVVDVEKCIRVYNNAKYTGERVMLLFTNPLEVLRAIEGGVKIKSINIGGMAYREGKVQVNNFISIDHEDINAFNQLSHLGIELEVRTVSSDTKLDMLALIKQAKK